MNHHKHYKSRKAYRLQSHDYSEVGFYFITICTYQRRKLFRDIGNINLPLLPAGKMVEKIWFDIHRKENFITLDEFIVMPDHFHAVVHIHKNVGKSVSQVIGAFKSLTTNQYIKNVHSLNWPPFYKRIWHTRFHDRIIRNRHRLEIVRRYIRNNVKNWY